MQRYAVGSLWPHRLAGEGMTCLLDPGEDGVSMMLVMAMPRPSRAERRAVKSGVLKLALLPSPPLVWIVAAMPGLSLDAPYAVGVHTPERIAALTSSARRAHAWPDDMRGLITIALVDTADGVVRALRAVSLSRAWWAALADGLEASAAPIDAAEHQAAMAHDSARWTTAAMLAAAPVVEAVGRA